MEERAKFVLEALEGWTSMTELCARYGISRRVGYKWLHRYEEVGLSGLADRSRAPRRRAAATPLEQVNEIIALRSKHPTWGPRKLRAWLDRKKPETSWPACSTIGAILKREGLTKNRRRRPRPPMAWRPPRTELDTPNRVWTTDFKGEFRMGCGRLCCPLTILDAHSHFLLDCRALPGTATAGTQATFERVFAEYGLPEVIRTDNGIRHVYNEERPHEALNMQPPASVYQPAEKRMPRRLEQVSYPESFQTRRINVHSQICWRSTRYFLSETLRGQTVGLEFNDHGAWNIYFGPALLAELDDREGVIRRLSRRRR